MAILLWVWWTKKVTILEFTPFMKKKGNNYIITLHFTQRDFLKSSLKRPNQTAQ